MLIFRIFLIAFFWLSFIFGTTFQAFAQAGTSAPPDNRSFFEKLIEDGMVTIVVEPSPNSFNKLDGANKTKFENGEIKFDCVFTCVFGFNRPQLAKLYNAKQWEDLAALVVDIGYDTQLSYYYLGYSAEMLGFLKAADVYYKLGLKTEGKCRSDGMNLCSGIDLPNQFHARIREIQSKLVASTGQQVNVLQADSSLNKLNVLNDAPMSSVDSNEEIVIGHYKKELNYQIQKLSACRYKMHGNCCGIKGATQSLLSNHEYFFSNLQRADVVKADKLKTDLGRPYGVVLTSKGMQQLVISDMWFEPNTYNMPPSMGKPRYKDELFFKSEAEAIKFQSAIVAFVKSCN